MKVRMDELEKDETHGNMHLLQIFENFLPKVFESFFFAVWNISCNI